MISHTGKVLDTAASDEDDAVLLEIVTNSGNVGGNFDPVGKSDSGNFSKS